MKVGDVVKFVSNSWVTDRDYPNPGIIYEIHERRSTYTATSVEIVASVLWSNATLTDEHSCYLEVISESR